MLQFIFMVSKKALTSNTALSFNQSMPGKDFALKGRGKGAGGPKGAEAGFGKLCVSLKKSWLHPFLQKNLLIFPVSDEPDDQTGGTRSAR